MTNPEKEERKEEDEEVLEQAQTGLEQSNDVVEDVESNGNAEENGQEGDKKKIHMKVAADAPWVDRMWEVFHTFWPLGLVAFGGPQAHVAILRDHLVVQRDWLDEEQFTELFAIGQVRLETSLCVYDWRWIEVSFLFLFAL